MVSRSGASRRVVAGFLGAVLAVAAATACSSEADPPPEGESATTGSETGVSALEGLSADRWCELLPAASIERELGVTVEESEGTERGRAPEMRSPYFLTRECDYETGTFDLGTEITTKWDGDASDEEVLDEVFTAATDESGAVGDYERVPGLGALAGFGADATLGGADVAARRLGVVVKVGDERLLLTVHTLGKAELAQLRPLAEELLAGVRDGSK